MPLLSFTRQNNQSAQQKHPNTTSAYSYPFKVARPEALLIDDHRPADVIVRERTNLGQKLNNYLDARDAHREQVAYNHAVYANQIGNFSLRQPQNRFGVDPGKDTAWTPPADHQIPEFWPSQKSGIRICISKAYDWGQNFVHLNLHSDSWQIAISNIGIVDSSVFPLNTPSKWMTNKEKTEYNTQRVVFRSDLRQSMLYEFNKSLISRGTYVFIQAVRVSPYSYDEDLVAHFPESDVERELWREHLMDIPRPKDNFTSHMPSMSNTASMFQPRQPLQSMNPFRQNALPSYDQVWKQG